MSAVGQGPDADHTALQPAGSPPVVPQQDHHGEQPQAGRIPRLWKNGGQPAGRGHRVLSPAQPAPMLCTDGQANFPPHVPFCAADDSTVTVQAPLLQGAVSSDAPVPTHEASGQRKQWDPQRSLQWGSGSSRERQDSQPWQGDKLRNSSSSYQFGAGAGSRAIAGGVLEIESDGSPRSALGGSSYAPQKLARRSEVPGPLAGSVDPTQALLQQRPISTVLPGGIGRRQKAYMVTIFR